MLLAILVMGLAVVNPARATFQQPDQCNQEFTYTKTGDFDDSRVHINFESGDDQIDVSAKAGYQVVTIDLEVDGITQSGYDLHFSGGLDNYNPNPGGDIDEVKVVVKKVCEEPTPTPTDEVTPTPTEEPCKENCGNPPTFAGSTTEAPKGPICTGINPDQPIGREDMYQKTGPTSAHFEFFGGNTDHFEVEFGYSKDNLAYGIPGGLPGTSRAFDLNDLAPGFTNLFARVTAFRGGCVLHSEVFN